MVWYTSDRNIYIESPKIHLHTDVFTIELVCSVSEQRLIPA